MLPLHTLNNEIEAQVIAAAFRHAKIKFVIRKFEDSAYDGIYIAQKGYGQVLVAKEDLQRAKRIIADLSQSDN